jgi:hypothetical protein
LSATAPASEFAKGQYLAFPLLSLKLHLLQVL